ETIDYIPEKLPIALGYFYTPYLVKIWNQNIKKYLLVLINVELKEEPTDEKIDILFDLEFNGYKNGTVFYSTNPSSDLDSYLLMHGSIVIIDTHMFQVANLARCFGAIIIATQIDQIMEIARYHPIATKSEPKPEMTYIVSLIDDYFIDLDDVINVVQSVLKMPENKLKKERETNQRNYL